MSRIASMKNGIDVNVKVRGKRLRTSDGTGRHAMSAPIVVPRMKEMIVATISNPTVHGRAWPTMSLTVIGNCVSE